MKNLDELKQIEAENDAQSHKTGEFITSDFDTIHSNIQDTVKDVRQVYERAAGISADNQQISKY